MRNQSGFVPAVISNLSLRTSLTRSAAGCCHHPSHVLSGRSDSGRSACNLDFRIQPEVESLPETHAHGPSARFKLTRSPGLTVAWMHPVESAFGLFSWQAK